MHLNIFKIPEDFSHQFFGNVLLVELLRITKN